MVEKATVEFVKRIIGIFSPNYAPEPSAQKFLVQELSRHTLTPDQWGRVIDVLKNRHVGTGLPPIGVIEQAIHEAQAPARYEASSKRGKMIFRLDGYERALIVQLESAVGGGEHWVIASVIGRKHGEKVELQKNVGMDAYIRLALIPGAEFVGIYPDDPNLVYRGEVATAEEIAEINAPAPQHLKVIKNQDTRPVADGYNAWRERIA